MLQRIRNNKWCKIISIGIAFNFLLELFFPLRSMALTSGPEQPEMKAFTPVGTDDMVDLFTGDFHYNIPLLTVPGPNGGYPVNLAYNAGITMEQEASWVGLGWNVNMGCITRNMRGLPDDFAGDNVTKEFSMKPNRTIGVGLNGINVELFGIPALNAKVSAQLYYNNYKGFGIKAGLGLKVLQSEALGGAIKGDLDLSWDSQGGLGVSPSLSMSSVSEYQKKNVYEGALGGSLGLGCTLNSRQGMANLWMSSSVNASYSTFRQSKDPAAAPEKKTWFDGSCAGPGVSFGTASYVPSVTMPMNTFSIGGSVKLGAAAGVFANLTVNAVYSRQSVKTEPLLVPAYGLMYNQLATDESMRDFNREKDVAVNKHSKNLPVPVLTYDVFNVTGQNTGGVFRLYRSDIPLLTDNSMENESNDGEIGFDLGSLGVANHLGANLALSSNASYSGNWRKGYDGLKPVIENPTPQGELYEPYYFRMTGDMSENCLDQYNSILGSVPARFDVYIKNMAPETRNRLNDSYSINIPKRTIRERRTQHVSIMTMAEKSADPVKEKYQGTIPYPYNSKKPGHIAEITVTNPDGNKYIYGIAAYNNFQKDVNFSIYNLDNKINTKSTTFTSKEASTANASGSDQLYMSTSMPPYAHSYLLTRIVSPDYVDLPPGGISDNDPGYWVKFNYRKEHNDFQWRMPYTDANYSRGYDTDENDDKASFSYGTKEVWYLDSVETKTHVAIFYLNERLDGHGADGPDAIEGGSQSLLKLDSIKLFSKAERTTPVKTVHFEYSYALCWNVENHEGYLANANVCGENGKLTLKRVWFSYENNRKGRFSPYIFDYNETDSVDNPRYSPLNMDRWGYYDTSNIATFPYVKQDLLYKNTVDRWMGAWNLKKITLPSGGNILINYEADDYAYVQNKRAMQMLKITAPDNDTTVDLSGSGDLRVYFKPNKPTDNIRDYIGGLKDSLVYFKVYSYLKPDRTKPHYDYVEGYGKILPDKCGKDANGYYITFGALLATKGVKTNPIRLAAWQYIKMQRPDILFPAVAMDEGFVQVAETVCSMYKDIKHLIKGYYASANEYADSFLITDTYPSFIRLNNPDKIKRGGGHRVRSISLVDNWVQPRQAEYTTEYTYRTLEDGREISSGVAEWEPMIGGEENPFHHPVKYHVEKLFCSRNPELYVEEPFGESYYPAPSVGYSKVLVRTMIAGILGANGVQLAEYYTARDFPVKTEQTDIAYKRFPQIPIPIPTIGSISNRAYGYSQGYTINLNDMHGKMKRMATYRPWIGMNVTDLLQPEYNQEPVSKTEYIYNTRYPYNPGSDNELINTVTVLHGDNDYKEGTIGLTYDNFIDMRENYEDNFAGEILPNVDQLGIVVIPNAWLKLETSSSVFRTIVYTKVINRMGILTETRAYKDGALTANRNLMYDSETGEPLLTVTTSDFSDNRAENIFNNPYYNYTLPAHWYYPGMQGKYKNDKAIYSPSTSVQSDYHLGDAIVYKNNKYWLTPTPAGSNGFTGDVGQPPPADTPPLMIQSGNTNQQSVPAGTIVALKNPVTERSFPLFEAYNQHNVYLSKNAGGISATQFNYSDCYGKLLSVCVEYDQVNRRITFSHCEPVQGNDCKSCPNNSTDCSCVASYSLNETAAKFIKENLAIIILKLSGFPGRPKNLPTLEALEKNENVAVLNSYTDVGRFKDDNNCLCLQQTPLLFGSSWQYDQGCNCYFTFTNYDCNNQPPQLCIQYDTVENKITFKRLSAVTNCPPSTGNPCNCIAWITFDDNAASLPADPDGSILVRHGQKVEFRNANGVYTGQWHDPGNCFTECLEVLNANATEFCDSWSYNYPDAGLSGKPYPNNDYAGGRKGIIRPLRENVYYTERTQRNGEITSASQPSNPHSNIQEDGVYDLFIPFNWECGNALNQQNPWTWTSEITKYSPYGFDIENRNALNIYSSALYGYNQSLATAVAGNAGYYEIAYDGFEEFPTDAMQNGHFKYDPTISPYITNEESHTGDKSLKISSTLFTQYKITIPATIADKANYPSADGVTCIMNQDYLISGWIKGHKNQEYTVQMGNIMPMPMPNPLILETPIEGWQRFEVVFKPMPAPFDIIIRSSKAGIAEDYTEIDESTDLSSFYLDDVRLHPFNASMKSYVYDPRKFRTVAELDDNNFATFYNYDEEGTLVQVKKETAKGIMTIRTTRQHTRKNPLVQ